MIEKATKHNPPTKLTTAITNIFRTGDIIPANWKRNLLNEPKNTKHGATMQKGNLLAVSILAHIVYWNTNSVDRLVEKGKEREVYYRKFAEHAYWTSYEYLAEQNAHTKADVKSAIDFLVRKGLIERQFNVDNSKMYLTPIPSSIEEITYNVYENGYLTSMPTDPLPPQMTGSLPPQMTNTLHRLTDSSTENDVGVQTFKEAKSETETHVFEENEVPVIRGYPKTFAMSKKNAGSSKFSGSRNDSDMDIENDCVGMDNSTHVNRLTTKAGIGAANGSKSLTRQSSAFYGNPENEEEYMEEGNARGMKVDRMTFENEVISQLKKAVKHNDLVAICGDLGMVDIQDLLRAFAEDFASGKGKEKNLVFRDKIKTNDYRYNSSVKGVGLYFKKWVASVSPEKLISDGKVTVDFSKEDELAKKLRDFCLSPAYGHKQARNYNKRPESGIKEDLETVKAWLRDGWKEDDIVKLVCVFTWTTGNDYTYPRLTVSPKELRYLWKDLDVQNTFNPEKNERIRSHYNYYYKNK